MSDVVLGKLLDCKQHRDAIHVAVAPVCAVEDLMPGEHIGFAVEGDTQIVCKCLPPGKSMGGANRRIVPNGTQPQPEMGIAIGIVDPFLTTKVKAGQWFYMFLYQNTVTSLRHEWEHPAFHAQEAAPVNESKKWIRDMADACDITYSDLIDAAGEWVRSGGQNYFHVGDNENYKNVFYGHEEEFWRHFEIVTGVKAKDKEDSFFSCSC